MAWSIASCPLLAVVTSIPLSQVRRRKKQVSSYFEPAVSAFAAIRHSHLCKTHFSTLSG